MKTVLRSTLFFVAFGFTIHVPFFASNKPAAAVMEALTAVFMLAIPYALLRRGRPVASARTFLVVGAVLSTILVVLGRGVASGGTALQLVVAVIAAIMLGRNAALWVSFGCLGADLAVAIFEVSGGRLPVVFPGNPLAAWFLALLAFVLTAPPLYTATRVLREALDEVRNQLAERREAEEQIVYQAQLIAQTDDPVIAADNQRMITFWNAAAARITGWREHEAIGKSLDEVVRWAPGSIPRQQFRDQLYATGKFNGELAWFTRSGSVLVVDAAVAILCNAAGEPIGTVGGFRDITARRRAEEALKHSEERLRMIAETAPVGIVLFDSAGHLVFANTFAASLVGVPREEIPKHRYDDTLWKFTDLAGNPIPPEDRTFRRALATRRPVSGVECAFLTPQEKRVYMSVSAAPILNASGEVEGVVTAMEDITARHELEEQYLHSQKMEGLGRLAGGVAHDFNNLLTVINGYSQVLLRRAGLEASAKTSLEQILKAGESAAELARQLMAFGRKQIGSPRPLALNAAIRDAELLLRRVLGDGIELVTRLDPSTGTILADSGQVQRVVMNLVLNARDAMPDGGRMSIVTRNIESPPGDPMRDGDAPSGAYVLLQVEDSGVGMDRETQLRIFEPFFTTKQSGKGTGLGLSTVFGIIKQNGGWIRVESEPWKGARFSVYLPRIESPAARLTHPDPAPAGGDETVLVVEDQPVVRQFLVECLQNYGYSVFEAGSGAEALEIARQLGDALNLLVTDMSMPGMSGRKLAETLEARRPGLRVLLVSGYSEERIEPLGLPSSHFAVLPKPVSPEALATAVRSLLETAPA